MENINVLYIHGMGGGGDSRIPSILKEHINPYIEKCYAGMADKGVAALETGCPHVSVVVRTYSFDPEVAWGQISSWMEELKPVLVVGESLGSLNAIRIKGVPHILVSPSLNAPVYLGYLAFLALIPGVTQLFDRIYRPKDGDRQRLHFTFRTLRKYRRLRREALANSSRAGGRDAFFAFFGTHDHYRRSGIVSIRTWRKYFGPSTYRVYEGTHFMEEEFVLSLLMPKIVDSLFKLFYYL
ncbi:MAG: hypothetical protein IAC23_01810 [Bacteroidetes bacterium]|uniref:Alpha/beta hydrolase n=1 Tax=Candidatus Cryptobacteroides merdavium TaxID=2840769 RepID=A0A9D9HB17_9BACT|nr:hypothetical protein [Candidatus Cryptobacteroides merdavium]